MRKTNMFKRIKRMDKYSKLVEDYIDPKGKYKYTLEKLEYCVNNDIHEMHGHINAGLTTTIFKEITVVATTLGGTFFIGKSLNDINIIGIILIIFIAISFKNCIVEVVNQYYRSELNKLELLRDIIISKKTGALPEHNRHS